MLQRPADVQDWIARTGWTPRDEFDADNLPEPETEPETRLYAEIVEADVEADEALKDHLQAEKDGDKKRAMYRWCDCTMYSLIHSRLVDEYLAMVRRRGQIQEDTRAHFRFYPDGRFEIVRTENLGVL